LSETLKVDVQRYDLLVVGAGIVGLAHALEGVKRGLKVCVVEANTRPVGASIRNFGFITVTGQAAGDTHCRAQRTRDVWDEIAPQAGIDVIHRGLWMIGQRPEAHDVLTEFMRTDMAAGCELLTPHAAAIRAPSLRLNTAAAVLYSPHERRVESREVIPKLISWLASAMGVSFRFGETVLNISTPEVVTSRGQIRAERVVYCPGTFLRSLFADRIDRYRLTMCRLQMLRVMPDTALTLPGAVMSDLSLVRYAGYAALPAAAALRSRLIAEEPQALADGIHLIAVQSADGSLVVGDSHHYDATPEPFASAAVEDNILRHLSLSVAIGGYKVTERWVGEYPSSSEHTAVIDCPDAATRVVLVTSGTGASTAFGLAQDVFSDW
jgi:FAD dependent oxidoreductase TIGR03364